MRSDMSDYQNAKAVRPEPAEPPRPTDRTALAVATEASVRGAAVMAMAFGLMIVGPGVLVRELGWSWLASWPATIATAVVTLGGALWVLDCWNRKKYRSTETAPPGNESTVEVVE